MDVTSLASAMVGSNAALGQFAMAAKMMKMNAQADAAIAQLVDAATQNASRLANVDGGIGAALDVSA
jgi:hypothetical protein